MDAASAGIFGFLVGISFWWWLVIIIGVIGLFPLVEREKGPWALLALLVTCVLLYFAAGVNVAKIVWYDLPKVLGYGIVYLAVGAGWSLYKWRLYANECRTAFDETHKEFVSTWIRRLENNEKTRLSSKDGPIDPVTRDRIVASLKTGTVPDELLPDWRSERSQSRSTRLTENDRVAFVGIPSPFKKKSTITTWIAFWPWSMVWYFFCDLIMDLINAIWRRLVMVYTRISEYAFKDVDKRLLGD